MSEKLWGDFQDIEDLLDHYAGDGTDPWHTDEHNFKDDLSAPWYRALYKLYINKDPSDFRALIKLRNKPPAEILPHVENALKKKRGRPATPSIFRKSQQKMWLDYELDRRSDYAKDNGTTLIQLLRDEAEALKGTQYKFGKRTIQQLLRHYEKDYVSKEKREAKPNRMPKKKQTSTP